MTMEMVVITNYGCQSKIRLYMTVVYFTRQLDKISNVNQALDLELNFSPELQSKRQ